MHTPHMQKKGTNKYRTQWRTPLQPGTRLSKMLHNTDPSLNHALNSSSVVSEGRLNLGSTAYIHFTGDTSCWLPETIQKSSVAERVGQQKIELTISLERSLWNFSSVKDWEILHHWLLFFPFVQYERCLILLIACVFLFRDMILNFFFTNLRHKWSYIFSMTSFERLFF